ncbi:MAG: sce7725 family protein, partial [Colwellia sp.]
MYFPYFRGKQNELILMRDNAGIIGKGGVVPIIEPVKSNTKPLLNTIKALVTEQAEFILITNSMCGDLVDDDDETLNNNVVTEELMKYDGLVLGFILSENTKVEELIAFAVKYKDIDIALIHFGFLDA